MSRLASRANVAPYQAGASPGAVSPLTPVTWAAAFWADDPSWSNPGDGNAVSSWRDGSGNGNTLAQGTGSKQPLFRSSVTNLNGKAGVDFDGTDDILTYASGPVITQACSVVAAFEIKTTPGAVKAISDAGGTSRCAIAANYPNGWTLYMGAGVGLIDYGRTVSAGAYGMRVLANNTASAHSFNMRKTSGSLATSTGFTGVTLGGANPGGASAWMPVRIGFFGMYQGDITADAGWPALVSIIKHLYAVDIA